MERKSLKMLPAAFNFDVLSPALLDAFNAHMHFRSLYNLSSHYNRIILYKSHVPIEWKSHKAFVTMQLELTISSYKPVSLDWIVTEVRICIMLLYYCHLGSWCRFIWNKYYRWASSYLTQLLLARICAKPKFHINFV